MARVATLVLFLVLEGKNPVFHQYDVICDFFVDALLPGEEVLLFFILSLHTPNAPGKSYEQYMCRGYIFLR